MKLFALLCILLLAISTVTADYLRRNTRLSPGSLRQLGIEAKAAANAAATANGVIGGVANATATATANAKS